MAGTKLFTEGLLSLVCESALIAGSDVLNSVEGIDIKSIQDRATCYVRDTDSTYRFFEASLAAPAGTNVILPVGLTVGEPGRWIIISAGGGGAVDSVTGIGGIVAAPTTGFVIVDGTELYARDGTNGAMTADVDFGGFDLTNAATGAFSGAVTGATFNGVALTTAGSATSFLNAAGNYVAISGFLPTTTIQNIAAAGPTAITNTMNTLARVNFAGAAAATLPAGAVGKQAIVKDVSGNASSNPITVSGGTIDGAASYIISTDYGSATFICSSTGPDVWNVV